MFFCSFVLSCYPSYVPLRTSGFGDVVTLAPISNNSAEGGSHADRVRSKGHDSSYLFRFG